MSTPDDKKSYALQLANDSYVWYQRAAIQSRRSHRISTILLQVLAAAIPMWAAINVHSAIVPAVLGAAIVVVSGVKSLFHWEENYLRFSASREAVETQRRLYQIGASPYDEPATRDSLLVRSITGIEQEEMKVWLYSLSPSKRGQKSD